MRRQVLLIGATGTFGTRLAGLLAVMPGLDLVLGARTPGPLQALCDSLDGAAASVRVKAIDRTRPADLGAPWLVIDASGPFRAGDYAFAQAVLRAGAHYIDLADGRAFVAGFAAAVGADAALAGVLAVTGASSTPALSQAALATLVAGWTRVDDVLVAIAPGARAPRGLAVLQSILSYAGQPLRVFRDGTWTTARGWSGLRRLDMPGLGRRLASLCDTPDLDLLPAHVPIRRNALFMAGLELPLMHLGLTALSLPVRLGLVGSLQPLARPLRRMADALAGLGTDRGGMIVEAHGLDAEGRGCVARWALWAEANAGPTTPAAPAAALVRAQMEGRIATTGAQVCVGLLGLDDILRELSGLPISTRIDAGDPDDPLLFRRLLGRRFDALPLAVRAVHGAIAPTTFQGRAIARAGRGRLATALRAILGLPASGPHDAQVAIAPSPRGEIWTRRFGTSRFVSRLVDTGRLGLFEERIGPLRFVFDLRPTTNGVTWEMIEWRLGPLALPLALAPRVRAAADDIAGRYRFRVVVAHPWFGLLFAYRGILEPGASLCPERGAVRGNEDP